MDGSDDIFTLAIQQHYLLYAPLHGLLALVNASALAQIRRTLQATDAPLAANLRPLVAQLQQTVTPPPVRTGPLQQPLLLGILPTRGCNMACRYCDFAAPKRASPVMSLTVARAAVDGYLALLCAHGHTQGEVHFFGGEPFAAPDLVRFVVDYTRTRAAELNLAIRFEATSNGLYSPSLCQWVADHFDTVVLSLDGPAPIHDHHRPALNGRGTSPIVERTAKLLGQGKGELILRTCVTNATVAQMPTIAQWMAQEFRPSTVCFESLTLSPLAQAAGLTPPDPWAFAQNFAQAAAILAAHQIRTVLSTAELADLRVSFCPVGQDALIVSPDGAIHACYLLEADWREKGLDMTLGQVDAQAGQLVIADAALQRVRQLNVYHKPLCAHCFCRYHCAGGCHVNHDTAAPPGQYSDLCIQTRLVTITRLLHQLGQEAVATAWLADPTALHKAAWQHTDRLLE